MPTYEFRCPKCDHVFQRRMSVLERGTIRLVCPSCKGRKVQPVLSGFTAKTSRKS